MLNSDMLDVAIGLVFVYLLFSFVATAMREALESWLKSRGVLLEKGILQLLTAPNDRLDPGAAGSDGPEELLTRLYQSTPIFSLFQSNYQPPSERGRGRQAWGKATKLPAYIPARSFAQALIEVVHGYAKPEAGGSPGSIDRLRLALEGVPNAPVRDIVRAAVQLSGGDPQAVSRYIEVWYSSVMDRVSGWYRRHTQWWVLGGSVVVAVALNVNTITVVQRLSENTALRAAVSNAATSVAADRTLVGTDAAISKQISAVRSVGLPIGWGPQAVDPDSAFLKRPSLNQDYFRKIGWAILIASPGWGMTALAISLGAPFWFDVLNKFMIVRTTVKPHEKSGEEGSKDPSSDDSSAKSSGDPSTTGAAPLRPPSNPPPTEQEPTVTSSEQAEIAALDPNERPREDD